MIVNKYEKAIKDMVKHEINLQAFESDSKELLLKFVDLYEMNKLNEIRQAIPDILTFKMYPVLNENLTLEILRFYIGLTNYEYEIIKDLYNIREHIKKEKINE